ncbi:unnamed protein product, partial [marine sediment metagenome]
LHKYKPGCPRQRGIKGNVYPRELKNYQPETARQQEPAQPVCVVDSVTVEVGPRSRE